MITIVKKFKSEMAKTFRAMSENDAFRTTGDFTPRRRDYSNL